MGKNNHENKYIDQKFVNDFAATRSLAGELADWMEAARANILQQLRSGLECPVSGPYLVVIEKSKQKVIDWRELLRSTVESAFRAQGKPADEAFARSVAQVDEYESGAKKKTSLRLSVKTNPAFEHKFAAKAINQLQKVKVKRS